jgi:hypothetical protein
MAPATKQPRLGVLDGGIMLPSEQMGMDLESFDNVVRGKGVPLIHHRAMRCPVGLIDPTDVRRIHEDHSGCSNGFLYKAIGRVTTTLTSNAAEIKRQEFGWFDGSTVMATFPRYYDSDGDKRVLIKPYDRFYLEQQDLLTGTWELTKRRLDGAPDKFEFAIVQVEHLIDSCQKEYFQHIDFDILASGDLSWRDGKGPNVGSVYTAWYQYRPYYYVERLIHELRLYPTADYLSPEEVRMERLGFGAVLQREYVHRTQTPDDQAPDKQKQQKQLPDIDEQV